MILIANLIDFAVAIGIFALGRFIYRKRKERAENEKKKGKDRKRARTSRV